MINVDSTIHDEVVSAAEAARILGVKRETLYAYASRGLLTRLPRADGRGGYLRGDVLRLKARSDARSGHGPVAAGALRWGEPVLDSSITSIDPRGPAYRGHVAIELARSGKTFEQVAELLWTGALPGATTPWRPRRAPEGAPALGELLRRSPPVARLALLIPWLALADRAKVGDSPEKERARARRLIARMASLFEDGDRGSIARAAAAGLGAKRPDLGAVDMALVALADHELNASSFAARVAASAGADLYACFSAALAALSGTRHGGECDRVERLVREAGAPSRAARFFRERARRGERVAGFGHPLYPAGDPRAVLLLDAARSLSPRRGATLEAFVRAGEDALGLAPTVDVGLVAVARALGMPRGSAAAIFALGRTAGWVAHVLEQREAGYLLRPRARYVGLPAV